jgi:hypothetical protein
MHFIYICSISQHKDDPMFAEFLETHGKSVNELIDDDDDEGESEKELDKNDDESDGQQAKEANKEISDIDVIINYCF